MLSDDTFGEIAALMHGAVGLSLPPHKKALVASRLGQRIQRLGLSGYEAYLARIRGRADADEFQVAVDLLTTHETYFFRERRHFDLLERELSSGPPRSIAAWSAACSYGDEAYSIAMLLTDLEMQGRTRPGWSVLATDISDQVLREAIEAVFPAERLRELTPQQLKRHCLRGEGEAEGQVALRDEVASRVAFGRLNLCETIDVPGPFDVIFLRNVLIYFDAPTKAAVVDAVAAQLRPGGLFFIGTAEGRLSSCVPLQPLGPGAYRRAA